MDDHHQEEGWPLGLMRPMNNGRISSSLSLSSLLSPSTLLSSSDLDSQSMESFFQERSMTLGSLIGITSIMEVSRRSKRTRMEASRRQEKNIKKYKPWIFSLCSKVTKDDISNDNNSQSLNHFLQAERQAFVSSTSL